jgi:hypothetical protein
MPSASHLPKRFSAGTKYVIESCGPFVRRYVEFPNGRRIKLATRKAVSCTCPVQQKISIVPSHNVDLVDNTPAFRRRIFA